MARTGENRYLSLPQTVVDLGDISCFVQNSGHFKVSFDIEKVEGIFDSEVGPLKTCKSSVS